MHSQRGEDFEVIFLKKTNGKPEKSFKNGNGIKENALDTHAAKQNTCLNE